MKAAVFLTGPIGVGKTTLGRALATRLEAAFVDGDDHHLPGRSWFGSSLTTSRAILAAALAGCRERGRAVVAYPLRRRGIFWFRGRMRAEDVRTAFIGLSAPLDSLTGPDRERRLNADERLRTAQMLAERYGAQDELDAIVSTAGRSVDAALADLVSHVRAFEARASADGGARC